MDYSLYVSRFTSSTQTIQHRGCDIVMRTCCVKNGLVMVVILLFVGVAVQPAIAVNPIYSDNEDNCNICPKVSKLHLVRLKSLIKRVEILNNKLSVMSKHNPEVADKYKELSDRITTLTDINKEVKTDATSWDFPIFCKFLEILAESVIAIGYYGLDFIYGILVTLFPKLEYIIYGILVTLFPKLYILI